MNPVIPRTFDESKVIQFQCKIGISCWNECCSNIDITLKPEGCSAYEYRPTACRYYPIALISSRRQDEYVDREAYAMVKEEHCLSHNEPREISVAEYRAEQGLPEYDELARGLRQLNFEKTSFWPHHRRVLQAQSGTLFHGLLLPGSIQLICRE